MGGGCDIQTGIQGDEGMVGGGCDRNYIGQTGSLLGSSFRRHDPISCLTIHCIDTGNNSNWPDTHIVGSATFQGARDAIEALHSEKHSVNHFMH